MALLHRHFRRIREAPDIAHDMMHAFRQSFGGFQRHRLKGMRTQVIPLGFPLFRKLPHSLAGRDHKEPDIVHHTAVYRF
ncbi:hypothetical protein D1872_279220 [compost metagenome]